MNNDEKKKIYQQLSAPFGPEAIERTDGSVTGRGFSTTGIKAQFIINRLNDVVGIGGHKCVPSITVRTSTSQKGRVIYEATCELVLELGGWVDGAFIPFAQAHAAGGHSSFIEGDARKGAFTQAIKRAAACFGCGRQAYEGTIDDDNVPLATADEGQRRAPPERRIDNERDHQTQRNRLTSKQLGALTSLARKLNIERNAFRNRVRERFGVMPEFLTRDAASALIGELSAKLGNGHIRDEGKQAEAA